MSHLLSFLRLCHIIKVCCIHGFKVLVLDPIATARGKNPVEKPDRFRMFLEDLGGSFLKLGQMLALQPDILPAAFCDALFDLMDRVAPFGYDDVVRIVKEELGEHPEDLFDQVEVKPLATASIGQVHRAVLKGRKVALKVQRPNCEVDTAGDIRMMIVSIRLIRLFRLHFLDFMLEPLNEFVHWTGEELDYRNEARYMRQCRTNAVNRAAEHVPEVFHVTRRVLVVEFLEGITALDYLRHRNDEDQGRAYLEARGLNDFDESRFSRNIIDNFLGDAFNHGIFHADLHPANLMILPNNTVGYMDYGITGVLSRFSREMLLSLTLAYIRADLDKMVEVFFQVSSFGPGADPEGFRRGLEDCSRGWYEKTGGEVRLRANITLVMLNMLTLSRTSKIMPERDVIKYIRSSIALDGLITRLDPSYEVTAALENLCEEYLEWGARRKLVSYDRALQTLLTSSRLMTSGASSFNLLFRNLLSRQGDGQRAPVADANSGGNHPLPLAFLILILAYLISSADHGNWGVNLYTAEVALLAATMPLFLTRIFRSLWS